MAHLADALKEQGNKAFKNGDFLEAEDFYTQAVQKFSRNPLLFTNRANARLKLQRWEGAVNDCLKSIEVSGKGVQNHKAYYFLDQEANATFTQPGVVLNTAILLLLSLHHPNEALSSALTAYDQVRNPAPTTKTSPKDLETFSAFVLKCKKAKFSVRDRDRLRRQGDLRAEFENTLELNKQRDLDEVSRDLQEGMLGQVEAYERNQEVMSNFEGKVNELRSVFALADPTNQKPREIPDHLIDMITFEPMHDPVMTINGHSYERSTIYEHLKRSKTDPLTREPLSMNDLRPNYGLKAACDEFWESGASDWIIDW
ncbi:hypothetical protein Q7P37_006027 [Cladosporium fusiforme]